MTQADREAFQAYLASWQQGRLRPPELLSQRGRHLRLEWSGCELHLDDELWPGSDHSESGSCAIELTIEGDWVEFLAPAAPGR